MAISYEHSSVLPLEFVKIAGSVKIPMYFTFWFIRGPTHITQADVWVPRGGTLSLFKRRGDRVSGNWCREEVRAVSGDGIYPLIRWIKSRKKSHTRARSYIANSLDQPAVAHRGCQRRDGAAQSVWQRKDLA